MPSEKKTNQISQTISDPWKPAQPALQGLLGQLETGLGTTGLTPNETGAFDQLTTNAQQPNPYAPQIGQLANDLFKGGPDRTGVATGAYDRLQTQLDPFAKGQFVDPYSNPALQPYLNTLSGDIQNRVNSMFASSGRDLSPANIQATSRGIAEGVSPVLAQSYEAERGRQMSAINQLYGAGNQTAGLLSGLDQTAFGNRQAGVGVSQAAQQAQDSPQMRMLQIEAMKRGIPMENLSQIAQMLIPTAGLGTQGQGTQVGTMKGDPWDNIFKALNLGGKLAMGF